MITRLPDLNQYYLFIFCVRLQTKTDFLGAIEFGTNPKIRVLLIHIFMKSNQEDSLL